jgi:glutamate--cysteine ligase
MEALLSHHGSHSRLRNEDLFLPFVEAFTPAAASRVGTEAEKLGVLSDTLAPLPYSGARSVQAVLGLLADRFGWHSESEYEGGPVISMRRGNASITLEPGGQVELSGAPFASVCDTSREWDEHLRELAAVGDELGITWLGLGFHPFAAQADLSWVPKLRYGIMREYLPTRGSMGLDMMRRTCTVQVNLDYASEADAMDKMRVLLAISPIVTALFANSPWVEGRATGELSHRATVWLNTDPDRTGLLPCLWEAGASFERYVQWALDIPMFLIKRGKRVVANTGQTFRDFMRDGFEGEHATLDDWTTHLGTLFPEIRLKRTIEVRGADCVGRDLVPALAALAKGLVYDPTALDALRDLVEPLRYDDVNTLRGVVGVQGLTAELAGRPVLRWAEAILETADAGLGRISGDQERVYLKPLQALVSKGLTPAGAMLAEVDPARPLAQEIVRLSTYA